MGDGSGIGRVGGGGMVTTTKITCDSPGGCGVGQVTINQIRLAKITTLNRKSRTSSANHLAEVGFFIRVPVVTRAVQSEATAHGASRLALDRFLRYLLRLPDRILARA